MAANSSENGMVIGDDQRAAHVAEEQKKRTMTTSSNAVGQIVQDGVGGVVHQFAAVEVRNDLHAWRQQPVVQFVDLLVQGSSVGRRRRPCAAARCLRPRRRC